MKFIKILKWIGIILLSLYIILNIAMYFGSFFGSGEYKVMNKFKVVNNTLYFKGEIDSHEFRRFNEFFNEDISTFVVNSWGGDIQQGILIGEVLSKNNITVIVDGVCGSSCANYFFASGTKRIITKGSFVLYHGGLNDGTFDGMRGFPIPVNFSAFLVYGEFIKTTRAYASFFDREIALYDNKAINNEIIIESRKKLEGDKYSFWIPDRVTFKSYGFDTKDFWFAKTQKEKDDAINSYCKTEERGYDECKKLFGEFLINIDRNY